MSGFEIAGIVLRAFPIAINALEAYPKIAHRLGLFYKIRLEYKKWREDLEFHKLTFTTNLRKLLLPLVADDQKIKELLLSPGGDCWKEEHIAELLQKRLQESYGLYMQYIQRIRKAMDEINGVLAIDSEWTQRLLDNFVNEFHKRKYNRGINQHHQEQNPTGPDTFRSFVAKKGLQFLIYKFKLTKNDSIRKRLFDEVNECNGKLEALLKASDKDACLVNDRKPKHQSEHMDIAICDFWKRAKNVFQALASAWVCQCQQHGAKLLLQHRTEVKAEFDIIITGFNPSDLGVHKIRVSESDDMVAAKLKQSVTLLENQPSYQLGPKHYHTGTNYEKNGRSESNIELQKPPPLVTLTCIETPLSLNITREILSLCASFKSLERSCYGYLTGEGCRYYIYNISQQNTHAMPSVTLDQILQGKMHTIFTRSERYTLSLTIASTCFQLLDSPWLTSPLQRVDIIFPRKNKNTALIEEPHISQNFKGSLEDDTLSAAEKHFRFAEALDHLGIMLLELCFGQTIEDQPGRKKLPAGQTDTEKAGFDVLAAREWQCRVNEEAGGDYASAVSWCLGGNRSAPPEKWRQQMLHRVILPLQRSRDYLANGGIEA